VKFTHFSFPYVVGSCGGAGLEPTYLPDEPGCSFTRGMYPARAFSAAAGEPTRKTLFRIGPQAQLSKHGTDNNRTSNRLANYGEGAAGLRLMRRWLRFRKPVTRERRAHGGRWFSPIVAYATAAAPPIYPNRTCRATTKM